MGEEKGGRGGGGTGGESGEERETERKTERIMHNSSLAAVWQRKDRATGPVRATALGNTASLTSSDNTLGNTVSRAAARWRTV